MHVCASTTTRREREHVCSEATGFRGANPGLHWWQVILMGSKEQLAKTSEAVKAIGAAHGATKGKIVFVTSEFGSENAEALVDFFEVDPKAKDIQVL